ncbi:MAG: hypothetical protein K8S62_15685 [Candidatus Sabulitectum sp.]|nr:hypothetical protein [Candidatus Sabulitectum sp.]
MIFSENSIKALTVFGLNNLEANVYLALLKEPGITGYRVGKNLGKAVSNVYQALESLVKKGLAILHCEGKDRRYSAVPVKEIISRFKSDLEAKSTNLERELKNLEAPQVDTSIYRIDNQAQLFSKIEALVSQSRSTILLTADPFLVKRVQPSIEQAAARGIKVLVLTFEDMELAGCESLKLTPGKNGAWPGHWIVMDIDGIQHLIAFFKKPDTLTHAIWCNDQYVSYWIHFGMLADFTLMTFFEETHEKDEFSEIRKRLFTLYSRYNHSHPDVKSLYTIFDNRS